MATEIIIALITLAGSAVGTLGGIVINSRMLNYRIEQLEKNGMTANLKSFKRRVLKPNYSL